MIYLLVLLFLIFNYPLILTIITPHIAIKTVEFNNILNKISLFFFSVYRNLYYHITSKYKFAFLLPFILQKLDIEIPQEAGPFVEYAFNIGLLSTLVLLSFLNIIFYLASIYLISKYETIITDKYPKLSKVLKYYYNMSVTFIVVEAIVTILLLLVIIGLNVYICRYILFK